MEKPKIELGELLDLRKDDTKHTIIESVMIKCEPVDDYPDDFNNETCESQNSVNTDNCRTISNILGIEIEPTTNNTASNDDILRTIKQEPEEIDEEENAITKKTNTNEKLSLNAVKIEVEIQPLKEERECMPSISTYNEQQEIKRQQFLNDISKIRSEWKVLKKMDKKKYACDKCEMSFSKKDRLTKHLIVHLGLRYTCDVCQKQFSSKHNMLRHKHVHYGIKPFTCDHCGKAFMEKTYLAAHLRTHVEDKCYICSICKKEFREKAHLIRHERIHSGERPYTCEVCHKRFKQSAHLSCHKKIHKKKVVLYCDMCKQGFLTKEDLYDHNKVHIGEKAYTCEVCNRQFSQSSHLNDHVRVHSGKRPFSCPLCKKKFSQRSTLNRHIKIHSGEKPFSCPVCQKKFKQKSHVTKHVELHERDRNLHILPTSLEEIREQYMKTEQQSTLSTNIEINTEIVPMKEELSV